MGASPAWLKDCESSPPTKPKRASEHGEVRTDRHEIETHRRFWAPSRHHPLHKRRRIPARQLPEQLHQRLLHSAQATTTSPACASADENPAGTSVPAAVPGNVEHGELQRSAGCEYERRGHRRCQPTPGRLARSAPRRARGCARAAPAESATLRKLAPGRTRPGLAGPHIRLLLPPSSAGLTAPPHRSPAPARRPAHQHTQNGEHP